MSSPTPSPPSLHSDQDDSRDSTSSQFSNTVITKYENNNTFDTLQKADYRINGITSHGVEDILSDGVNYNINDNSYTESKPEALAIPHSFAQDYNSRDSTGFSIHDILGLHQSYNAVITQEELEPRYDYQILNYENISNSSNNYASGTEEPVTEECIVKDNIFVSNTSQLGNQVIYNRSYSTNDPIRFDRSGLNSNVIKDPAREMSDINESSFPGQVKVHQAKLTPNHLSIKYKVSE